MCTEYSDVELEHCKREIILSSTQVLVKKIGI